MKISIPKRSVASWLSEAVSFVLHPVFMPFYAVLLYFHVSPRFFLSQNIDSLTNYLLLVSVAIPLLFLLVLRFLKIIESFQLHSSRERLFFTVIMASVYFIIFTKLIAFHDYLELLPFFLGIFLSLTMLAVFNWQNIKPSIHTVAITGVLTFFLIWSYYSRINMLLYISIIIFMTALVVSARLYLQAHSFREITMGLMIGIFMQIISFFFILEFF